jgi:hypothetical protein
MGPHIHADPPAQQHPLAKQQKEPKVPHARTPTSSKHRAGNTLKKSDLGVKGPTGSGTQSTFKSGTAWLFESINASNVFFIFLVTQMQDFRHSS